MFFKHALGMKKSFMSKLELVLSYGSKIMMRYMIY